MKTVIAEKPSVAREIAVFLGASEKKEGYYKGNGYFVTWTFGHLVGLGMPEDYGISGFEKTSLPILPDPYVLVVRKQKKDKGYVVDPDALRQLKVIEKVITLSEKIIVATDAGREGELIFRYIYEYLKCSKPFERLWISSLTEKGIRQGFENLKTGTDFDGLFHAAQGRSRADWLVGINASQALSIVQGDGTYSLGRVQTPVLALICRRFLENQTFSVQKYWQIELSHTKDFVSFKSHSEKKWDTEKQAQDAFKSIKRNENSALITSIEIKNVIQQPPLLFDLTGLQKEANKKLNLSAEETLSIVQGLYEKKFITYPRTGSKYIPEDIWEEIPNLIKVLQYQEKFKEATNKLKLGRLNKRIVNDLRVTDHHALLITDKVASGLTVKENALYNMIAIRLLEAVSEACTKEVTAITLEVLHYNFILKGCKLIESGWRSITGIFFETAETGQQLPTLKKEEQIKIKQALVIENKTKAPVLYTEAGLLSAMETSGKEIENYEERKALLQIGIGTPATRASIIETLFERRYIQREIKSLIPTQKGLKVYELVKDKKIADVAMTAQWEVVLQKIQNKEADAAAFQKEMESFASSITEELLQSSSSKIQVPELFCPKCKKEKLIIRDNIVKCPDKICSWLQFRNVCGAQLTINEIENLVHNGKTSLIKGMKSRAGKKFNAYIMLNEKWESSFEFEKNKSSPKS
ncbi:type IA DNA topoisomerase [Flavobacterium sp. GSB-24]|uniref:type IA DNA topoisomerase n=1 Tax=Flavobacterium sp. GSB-24 TaxID=2994319 RepID=UPI00248FF692|nr:type IA DNA topoisomerase [Flavobacterium sp. GSB-24]